MVFYMCGVCVCEWLGHTHTRTHTQSFVLGVGDGL